MSAKGLRPASSVSPARGSPSGGQTRPDERASSTKLVFGLSSRTNKLKHAEYAESRRKESPAVVVAGERSEVKTMSASGSSPPASAERPREPQEPAAGAPASTRTQFHIPPPPARQGARGSPAGSVVSYAKARIYERPARQILSKPAVGLQLDGELPDSISSGFKPPKQVNVSKAREKWEGGEPFARCKSRQRLAALAGKQLKPLHGAWSMASVVASQQLQLQQALAAGNQAAPAPDSPVKVLTRGSVLERVQQFERSPSLSPAGGSPPTSDDDQEEGAAASAARQAHYRRRVRSLQAAPEPPGPKSAAAGRPGFRRHSSSAGAANQSIPRFYHPGGKPNTYELELQKRDIEAAFDKLPERRAQLAGPLARRHFHAIALACGFSEYFKEPLRAYVGHQLARAGPAAGRKRSVASLAEGRAAAGRLARASSLEAAGAERPAPAGPSSVGCDQFLACWRTLVGSSYDLAARFVHLLSLGQRPYLVASDLVPLVQSIIDEHPGLSFLRAAPDFHLRYIQTVIARLFYTINRSWTGKLTVGELRRSNLLAVLEVLSQEEDINQVTDYFSYEHFYVIYCKFWALDQDHDLLISSEDLCRHNEAAINRRIVERIFSGVVSRQIGATGKMSYSDFVWFLLAEEDKRQPRAVEYWFRLMDLDGDGYISIYEMDYFYCEQVKRLEAMNIEPLPFADCACQILDLVAPREPSKISLSDLKRTKMAPIFFDTFINLEKYLEHESREFVSSRELVQGGVVVSDWDRYASEAYESLVSEETGV